MASFLKDFTRSKPHGGSFRSMFTPRNTTSVIFSKGLLNAPGDNNCFLNSAVQVLWHLDVFRRSFREMSGHACMGKACIFCALKTLFTQLQHSEESVLPPDALRNALASAFKDQLRFQLGCMDDAAECFENILVRIHFHLAHNIKEDLCDAKHCIPHRKFAMTLIEHSVCKCGATSEPFPFTQMVHYVSCTALCGEASKMRRERRWPNTDHFGVLLRKAGAIGDVRDCPSSCGLKINIKRILMNCPDVVSIGLIWDSDKPAVDHISEVINNLGTTIQLRELFDDTVDDRAKANSLFLVGIVTYYGRHYTTFFYNTNLRYWVYFDDAVVKQVGHNWSDVVDRCRRGHFQPLLLLYAYPDGKAVTTVTAPKRTTLLKGYDIDDKENVSPIHQKKPEESLLKKALTEQEEPISINHHHDNSNSSCMSAQSASSNDSQNTLVYKPVGAIPEFQAMSQQNALPPKRESPRTVRREPAERTVGRPQADWQISEDGSVANASRASWIPNSVVEIGHDALNYVPMKKPSEGSYSISQFALGQDDHAAKGSSHRTVPISRVQNGENPSNRSASHPERPSSARDSSYGRGVPMSPQQSKRPSSAQPQISRQSVRQVSSSVVSANEPTSQRKDTTVQSQGGAMYNARTRTVTGPTDKQAPLQQRPQPSLSFDPYGNFSTEVERDQAPTTNRQLNIKPLQEFSARQPLHDNSRNQSNAAAPNQQGPKAPIVRQGSWSSVSSEQCQGDSLQRTYQPIQRSSSLNIKPLEKYQTSHSSASDLNNSTGGPNSHDSHLNGQQFPKYSSVPDLQQQASSREHMLGRQNPSARTSEGSKSMSRSTSLDNPIFPGGILDEAIRNRDPTPTMQNQKDAQRQPSQHKLDDQRHIPLLRSTSVTRNQDERQTRAKYNIQNGFLTLPGKKQANQFRSGSKQSYLNGSSGIGSVPGPQLNYESSPETRSHRDHPPSSESRSHDQTQQDGLTMRQTPEVHVTRGLDIDSIASRDSGYRSRDRSSASSGSVYSLDGHTSDTAPNHPPAKDISPSQTFSKKQEPPVAQNSQRTEFPRSQTPTRLDQRMSGPAKSRTEIQGAEDIVNDLIKGVEEQLLSSKKAEDEGDLAMALGLCTAAASTLKIALRVEGLNDQTKLFLQTKYNTTVLKSRGLHRRLTLLRRSQEEVKKFTAPSAPKQDHQRDQPKQVRDSSEEIRRDQESMQQIELLKKHVEDLSPHLDRGYGDQTGTGASRTSYQRHGGSVPSSPTMQRNRGHGGQGAMTSAPSYGHYHVAKGHGVPQGSSVGPLGFQTAQVQNDRTQIGNTASHGTMGRSATPLGFSASSQSDVGASRYRSQTPTAYMGSAKPSMYTDHHLHAAGNRNNNAINQATGRDAARGYSETPSFNQDWVRREQPRHEGIVSEKPMMFDTATFIQYNSTLPKQRGVTTGRKHSMGDNLIDLS